MPPPPPPPLPQQHVDFLRWASSSGVRTQSITPSQIPGAGLGIVATSAIPAGTTIAFCPAPLLVNLDTVAAFWPGPAPAGLRTHAVLALAIAHGHRDPRNKWAMWTPTLPSLDEMRGLPLLWSDRQRARLPSSARRLLDAMAARLEADYAAAAATAAVDRGTFTWAWLVVNTRTLFYPGAAAGTRHEDRMTLCPLVDYFNHSSRASACRATYSRAGYTVTTTADVAAGDEVFVTYGAHSGDFLLVEYGFVPAENGSDAVLLDPWMERLDAVAAVRAELEDEGWWGNWVLDADGWCYRTEVAVRRAVAGEGRWYAFLGGDEGGAVEAARVKGVLRGLLRAVLEDAEDDARTHGEAGGEVEQTIARRWRQIRAIVREVLEKT